MSPGYHGKDRRKGPRRAQDRNRDLLHGMSIRTRSASIVALTCWALVATVAAGAAAISAHNDDFAVTKSNKALIKANSALNEIQINQIRQHYQLQEGCIRLNILRAATNRYQYGTYSLFRIVLKESLGTSANKKQTRLFTNELKRAINAMVWIPLTDCVTAVALKGADYKSPTPISFSKDLPPNFALSTTNAQRPMPIGSVP